MRLRQGMFAARRAVRSVALISSFLLVAGAVQAADYGRFGPYVGVSGVYALPLFEDSLQDLNSALSVDESPGLNARLGLRLLRFVAIEAQYEWIDGFDVNLSGVKTATFEAHNITGNLRLHVPIWRVDPYILAGLGATFWKIDFQGPLSALGNQSGTGFAGRAGGGLDFYITEHFVLNAEVTAALTTRTFDVPNSVQDIDNLYYLSISAGLVYRF